MYLILLRATRDDCMEPNANLSDNTTVYYTYWAIYFLNLTYLSKPAQKRGLGNR